MSPRSPPNPLTDAAPLLFRGLWEVEFRTLRNGEADLGSLALLSLLESGGMAARAGDVPAHRGVQAGWPAAPRQGCVGEGAHGVTSVTQKWEWAQREQEGTFPRADKIASLRLHGVSVSRAPQESAGWIRGCWGW